MASAVASKRYAQAVLELAIEHKEEERWKAELAEMSVVLSSSSLVQILESPRVDFASKQALLSAGLKGISQRALNLSFVLTKKGRVGLIQDIAVEYGRLLDAHRGVEHAEVVTAVPLTKDDLDGVARKLGQMSGKKIVLEPKVNPDIIGGLVVRIGDQLIDGSIRTSLENMKKGLVSAQISG